MRFASIKKENSRLTLETILDGAEWTAAVKQYGDPNKAASEMATALLKKVSTYQFPELKPYRLVRYENTTVTAADNKHCCLTQHYTVYPDVKLGDYRAVPYVAESADVTSEEFDTALENFRKSFAVPVEKPEGVVENGDTAVIDFEGFLNGVAFPGGKGEKHPLVIGSGSFIPGFEPQLIGMKPGDERNVLVTFPSQYTPELAGKDAVFKVKLHAIRSSQLPELTDEFVQKADISPDVTTVVQLKEALMQQLAVEKQAALNDKAEADFLEQILACCQTTPPEAMVDMEVQRDLSNLDMQLRSAGHDLESYLTASKMTKEQVMAQLRPDCRKRAALMAVLDAIANDMDIHPTKEEIRQAYEATAAQCQKPVEEIEKLDISGMLTYDLKIRKTVDTLKGLR